MSGYYASNRTQCKVCVRKAVRDNRAKRRAQYAAYERERFQRPERKAAAVEGMRRHRRLHPDRRVARQAVNNAVRDGKIVRTPCERCGNPQSQGHHADYSKPLEVVWLCFSCHRKEHGQVPGA